MYDLEQIHNVIFAQEIPYNGTANMGDSAIANILQDKYNTNPFSSLNPLENLPSLPLGNGTGDNTPPT